MAHRDMFLPSRLITAFNPSRPVTVLVLAFLVSLNAATAQSDPLHGLDAYIKKAMDEWEVPGLAIAVVKDDAVVLAKGYGIREIGREDPVTEQTLFAIASLTKAFTTASLAMLVEEGKIHWDDQVAKHIPDFQVYDPYTTREVTIRDLLTHRIGLATALPLSYGSAYSRDEIMHRFRFIEPQWGFRAEFHYHTNLYLAAGQVIPAVTDLSWDQFVIERIFRPLGMKTSKTTITALRKRDNVAKAHARIDGQIQVIPWRNRDNVSPAGSIYSNVTEMAQWIRLQLGHGMINGRRIIDSALVAEMHAPQTVVRPGGTTNPYYPETRFATYGLGWFIRDYRGEKVVEHTGGIDGMRSILVMIPEKQLGLIVLTNLNPSDNQLPEALRHTILDLYLEAPERDWSSDFLDSLKTAVQQRETARLEKEAQRVIGSTPSLSLDCYAGTYTHPIFGEATVDYERETLILRYGLGWIGDLEHWHYDTFRAVWRNPALGKSFITFTLDTTGQVDEMVIEDFDPGKFKRVDAE